MKLRKVNSNLDKYQLKIIKSKRKKILVLASAGSGKTYTIVNKIRYLLNNNICNDKDILCISFTNDAVNKLKQDLNNDNIDVLTFHKLALKIINKKKEVLEDGMLYHIINDTFNNDVLLGLYKLNKDDMNNLIEVFINRFKSNNFSTDYFYKIINKATGKDKILLKEIMKCYICYESYLSKENVIDFNDMINLAIFCVDLNNDIKYKYIIIDEYQDISMTKFILIKKIIDKNKACLLAVGDDFQSIYKFNGSDISLITNFKKYFLFSKVYKLKNTYRNSKQIIKVSSKFIMKNTNQINKKIKSNKRVLNAIEIIYYDDLNTSLNRVIDEDNINNLFILSRNNYDLNNVIIDSDINYKKMTIHKSKGLQSKYVFVINMCDAYNGFPNKIKDHSILNYVGNIKEDYLYSEERRLFYVALTRCEEKVYLFAPKNNPSVFVEEIKKYENVIIREK